MHRPTVYEFSRLNVSGSVLSKRKIKKLIENGCVTGFDDPRLLTIMGLRRRGYTPESLLKAVRQLGKKMEPFSHFLKLTVYTGHTRSTSTLNMELLESTIRDELNKTAPR